MCNRKESVPENRYAMFFVVVVVVILPRSACCCSDVATTTVEGRDVTKQDEGEPDVTGLPSDFGLMSRPF
jgi:hypothetical protein